MDVGLDSQRIAANLRRWSSEGIEPLNREHQQAYLLARSKWKRPKVEQVLAILREQTATHTSSAAVASEFYLVPREAVDPARPPAWMAEWAVTEKFVRDNYVVPEDVILDTWILVDGGCPRHLLGKGVKSMKFDEILSKTLVIPPERGAASAPAPDPSQVGAAEAGPRNEVPSAASSATAPANRDVPRGQQRAAEVPAITQPPSKRQRVLKLMHSDEAKDPEDREAESLESLVQKIKRAARHGEIYCAAFTQMGTVHFGLIRFWSL